MLRHKMNYDDRWKRSGYEDKESKFKSIEA